MSPSSSKRSNGPSPVLVVGIVVILVAVAAVLAIVLAGGSDDDDGAAASPTVTTVPVNPDELDPRIPRELAGEVRPVEIEGDALPPMPSQGVDPAIGMQPPTLIGEDGTGFVHTVSSGIDAPILVVFMAHWCPACNQELPTMVQLANDGAFPEDLKVYAVLTGIDATRPNFPPTSWLLGAGWPFDYMVDEPDMDTGSWKAAEAFGLTAFPFSVLINDGVVVDRWSGASAPQELISRITAGIS